MGEQSDQTPQPGWYDDPGGDGERYWDGGGWTAQTRERATDPPPSSVAAASRAQPGAGGRRNTRPVLVAAALAVVLVAGVGIGLLLAGGADDDDADAPLAESTDQAREDAGAASSADGELPIALQLVAEVDRPTGSNDTVVFTDVEALRSANLLTAPAPGGDGWTDPLGPAQLGIVPVGEPFLSLMQLRRLIPMEHVIGLTYDEVAASVAVAGIHGWLVPTGSVEVVRDRLRSSSVWNETGEDTFDRVAEFTPEILDGYEPDAVEERHLARTAASAQLRAGALRLDEALYTSRADPLGADPDWSALLERLASAQAVSGWLVPHTELRSVPEGGTPLEPADAVAMAAVLDGDGLADLLLLQYGDTAAAATNADAARTNLALYEDHGFAEGEVQVDGTTVLVRLRLVGDDAGTSDLFTAVRRLGQTGGFQDVIGTGEDTDIAASVSHDAGTQPLSGASFTVASKDFDEQLILGEISVALLENAGVEVDNQVNLGATDRTRAALEAGEVDHYWEYTGTAWISFLGGTDPIPDRVEQYEAVRDRDAAERGLFWLEPTPFNNTYGIALSQEADAELGGVDTITQMGELLASNPDAVTLCVESQFNVFRDVGLPGMEVHYGFEVPEGNVTVLDNTAIYGAVVDRDPCNFGEVFTTDGRIAGLDLKIMEDDQAFFPIYNAAPVFVEDVWTTYGQTLEELYAPVTAALDDATMQVLNARVAGGQSPADVAVDWLRDSGFIR